MVSFLDEKGVGELVSGIKAKCPEWAKVTQRRKQIIIGRAIRPKSVDCTGAENWYAFIGTPCVGGLRWRKVDLEWHIYIKSIYDDEYTEVEGLKKYYDNRIFFNVLYKRYDYCAYRVDRYLDDEKKQELYLTYKFVPKTLKGTSLTQEWQNGKHVNNRKISLGTLRLDLCYWDQYRIHEGNKKRLEYRRVVKMNRSEFVRERTDLKLGAVLTHKKETSWLNYKSNHKRNLKTGIYKVRDGYAKTSWQTIYVKVRGKEYISVVFK